VPLEPLDSRHAWEAFLTRQACGSQRTQGRDKGTLRRKHPTRLAGKSCSARMDAAEARGTAGIMHLLAGLLRTWRGRHAAWAGAWRLEGDIV